MSDEFDLVVIGAGSGGVAASRRDAVHDTQVLIVKANRLGAPASAAAACPPS